MAPRMRSCRKGTKFGKRSSNLNRPIKRPHRLQRISDGICTIKLRQLIYPLSGCFTWQVRSRYRLRTDRDECKSLFDFQFWQRCPTVAYLC
uniref:Uncharacterized protein n=1 Tax=Ascaris lumbricoides TaxID=6252 RepID=A0A0M3HGE6_ASCLU